MKLVTNVFLLITALLLQSCAVVPNDLASQGQDKKQKFKRLVEVSTENQADSMGQMLNNQHMDQQIRISPGDMLRIKVIGLEQFDGLYQINHAGALELPYMKAVTLSGLNRQQSIEQLKQTLIKQGWLYQDMALVELSIVRLAPIKVGVSGAVFNPGNITLNHTPKDKAEDPIQQQGGVFATARNLFAALRSAGGVRPDANLSGIYLKRKGQVYQIDLSGLMDGHYESVPILMEGDQLYVASTGSENSDYIRPSLVTPPGMRVFMSNLTAPALSNAQSNIGNDSSRLPYGITLIDAVVSANCVGGTHNANASRSVVLITRNYGSSTPIVIKRSINDLLRTAYDKAVNPYIMPNDAIACYDSKFTNFRDVARGLGELINPIILGRLL